MSTPKSASSSVRVRIRNIGGIDETTVTLEPGVNILTGRNATNRTSFLRALMGVLGSDDVALKGDANEGMVELMIGDNTYTRTLTRQNGTVVFGGDPYLNESEAADLFAFLLEDNEARRAVRTDSDLRELIMRPVDTDEISAEIEYLTEKRDDLDNKLESLDELKRRLPDLEGERQSLRSEIEDTEETLANKEAKIEQMDTSVQAASEANEQLDEALSDLRDLRSDLDGVRKEIEAKTRSLDALTDEEEDVREKLETLEEADCEADVERLESEVDRLRRRDEDIQSTVSQLQSVIQYNEEMLSGTGSDVAAALRGSNSHDSDAELTDKLVHDSAVVCWTCGTSVDQSDIEETLDRLRSLRAERREELSEVRSEISELETRHREGKRRLERQQELSSELDSIEQERNRRSDRIDELRAERADLEERVRSMEEAVDELQRADRSDLLEKHREANELEFELGRLNDELEDVEGELSNVEEELDKRDALEAEREEVSTQLDELRTRIDRIEEDAVNRFNEHMDVVLNILDYGNLNRVWIERRSSDENESNWFDLHIVRTTEAGSAYEDTVDHLSESEREVTGLVFALAGYLVHDLEESAPFLLLDSLEAIDSHRIARLIDYMTDHTDYLVPALLPEDDQAVDEAYRRIPER